MSGDHLYLCKEFWSVVTGQVCTRHFFITKITKLSKRLINFVLSRHMTRLAIGELMYIGALEAEYNPNILNEYLVFQN